MTDYEFTDDMGEISGFGDEYEEACRKMLQAGLEWADDRDEEMPIVNAIERAGEYPYDTDTDAYRLQEHMNDAIGGEATGAMIASCTSHAMWIDEHGWGAYAEMMRGDN